MPDGLEAARYVRSKRAEVAKKGGPFLAAAVTAMPEWARTWEVRWVVKNVPYAGPAKISLLCERLGIWPTDTLESLTQDTRHEIARFIMRVSQGWSPLDAALDRPTPRNKGIA